MDYTKIKNKLDRIRGHELFPQNLLETMPKLYTTEGKGYDATAIIKLFHPLSSWYWYLVEFDGSETFYGLVIGHEIELGYSNRSEFEIGELQGLPFERDLGFDPTSLKEILTEHKKIEPDRSYLDLE